MYLWEGRQGRVDPYHLFLHEGRDKLVVGSSTRHGKLKGARTTLPRNVAIKMRKYFKLIVLYAVSLVVFGFGLLLFFLALLISNSCDDAAGETAHNSRGDIVKERLTICTGVGTVINHPLFCCR